MGTQACPEEDVRPSGFIFSLIGKAPDLVLDGWLMPKKRSSGQEKSVNLFERAI